MNTADASIPDGCIAPVCTINSFQPQTSAFDVKRCRHRRYSVKTNFFRLAMSIFTSDGTARHFFNIPQASPDHCKCPSAYFRDCAVATPMRAQFRRLKSKKKKSAFKAIRKVGNSNVFTYIYSVTLRLIFLICFINCMHSKYS